MRGDLNKQSHLFAYFSPESRVREDHPLRTIKGYADQALERLSGQIEEMYSATCRPPIPPERLLKAKLLIALYTVRLERLFCEVLDYNLLFRWFLDMDVEEASFDASTFSKNWSPATSAHGGRVLYRGGEAVPGAVTPFRRTLSVWTVP